MKFVTPDEIEDLFYGDRYQQVTEETVVSTSRWSNSIEQVLYDTADCKYYLAEWEVGATEYQDVDMEVILTQVEPYEVTVTKYRKVK